MDKKEINRLLFCMKERDELADFRDILSNGKEVIINAKKFKFLVFSRFSSLKKEYSLSDIQMTKLWAYLDMEVKYLEKHISNADPEEKEIAEAIYSGEVGKDALKF